MAFNIWFWVALKPKLQKFPIDGTEKTSRVFYPTHFSFRQPITRTTTYISTNYTSINKSLVRS